MELELRHVTKVYGHGTRQKTAVSDLSWSTSAGDVFALLGPNGAGKSSMLRMILDIVPPTHGDILINGQSDVNCTASFKQRVGYLPEERGLYRNRKIIDVLVYLGALKGLTRSQARKNGLHWLERFELADYANKRVDALSKGMNQKLQLAACLLHDPDVIILDEPFSGLDPVNVRMVRDIIAGLRDDNKLIILSTHTMPEVESLCNRMLMINDGQQVLYGNVRDIQKQYSKHHVVLDRHAQTEGVACIDHIDQTPEGKFVQLRAGKTICDLMAEMGEMQRTVSSLQEAIAPLEEIFVDLVKKHQIPQEDEPAHHV